MIRLEEVPLRENRSSEPCTAQEELASDAEMWRPRLDQSRSDVGRRIAGGMGRRETRCKDGGSRERELASLVSVRDRLGRSRAARSLLWGNAVLVSERSCGGNSSECDGSFVCGGRRSVWRGETERKNDCQSLNGSRTGV